MQGLTQKNKTRVHAPDVTPDTALGSNGHAPANLEQVVEDCSWQSEGQTDTDLEKDSGDLLSH